MKKIFSTLLICMIMINFSNAQEKPANNPLVMDWNTPYQTPPFSKIQTEHYLPAFEYAIAIARDNMTKIASTKSTPTFENTIVALDRSSELLTRISNVFFNILYCNTTPELQELSKQISPMLTKYSNDITLNEPLFARVKYVYDNEKTKLNKEDYMLLFKTYRMFINNGANLNEKEKEEYKQISLKLSTLSLDFSQNVLNANNAYYKNITNKKELQGIPESDLEIAASKAKAKELKGWVFDLSYPSYSAIMKYAENRNLRKEFFLKSNSKAYLDNFDNSQNIIDILTYRQQVANLLGFDTYADYVLQDRMAENPENVYKLLDQLLDYSYKVAQTEVASLSEYAKSIGFNEKLERWDFSYYSEKQKNSLFNMSDEILKPYFKLENVIDGVFNLASNLYNVSFIPNDKIEKYHPDVKVYEVYKDKQFLAILYLDFHPRESKKDGAWMTSFREQRYDENGNDIRPLVSMVMNFTPSTENNPSLLTFYEVRTFLHEFGHALHGMFSNVKYESIAGTSVPRDFVELPSQIMENWACEKDFLKTFALHYKTNEVIPIELINKLKEYDNYLAGYTSVRQLSFGYLDMMWHTIPVNEIKDIVTAERSVFDKMELFPVVPKTCMSTAFSHIFAGGYAAGYYGYKWAEVLDADAFSLFAENGVMNKTIAEKFYNEILSKGGSEKAMDLYINFRGREPEIDALLKRSGLK